MKVNNSQFGFCYPVHHFCGHFAQNRQPLLMAPVCAIASQRRRSTSLQLAKKKQHDTARMAAFMNKKDAQNLPFYNVENGQLQELFFNSLLRMKKCQPTCKKMLSELEKKISTQATCISFLRTENADLKVSNNFQSEKCLNLSKEIDRITEKSKKRIETQKKRIRDLETMCDKKPKNYKPVVSHCEHLKAKDEFKKLRSENNSLQETVKSLTTHIEQLMKLQPDRSKIVGSAKEEMKLMNQVYVEQCEYEQKDTLCNKCGSPKFHPWEECPADVFSIICQCCKKPGHFTLMCKHLGRFFSGLYL